MGFLQVILRVRNRDENGGIGSLISFDLSCRRQISIIGKTVSKENQRILKKT
jgi:hypothetical protein